MTEIYVLIGEYGEYEQHTTMVLGVFSSEAAAHDAIPKFKELGERQWAAHQEHDRRRDQYLTRFEPDRVYPPGSPFPNGCTLYKNDQYREADEHLGPAPALIPTCDEYIVKRFNLDQIEAHR